MSEAAPKWVGPADSLINQAYYRVLSFVSFHAPYTEALAAIRWLAENKRGGKIEELRRWGEYGVSKWNNVEVYPNISVNLWVFGGPRNTVYARVGWWKMYLIESLVRRKLL